MKKLIILLILLVPATALYQANASKIVKENSNCEIKAIDDLHLGKSIQKVWTLKYKESNFPVTVLKRKTAEGVEFIVYSNFFEVCYSADENGFGAKPVRKSWSSIPANMNKSVINADELKKQKVITTSAIDDEYAVGLIAGFLPDLMNSEYKHLLN